MNAIIQTAQPTEHQRAHTGQEPSECNEFEEAFKISILNIRKMTQWRIVMSSLSVGCVTQQDSPHPYSENSHRREII